MVKLPLGKLVKVNWLDHCGFEGWHDLESLLKITPVEVSSVGHIVVLAEDWIILAADVSEDGMNGVSLIITSCIQSCTELITA